MFSLEEDYNLSVARIRTSQEDKVGQYFGCLSRTYGRMMSTSVLRMGGDELRLEWDKTGQDIPGPEKEVGENAKNAVQVFVLCGHCHPNRFFSSSSSGHNVRYLLCYEISPVLCPVVQDNLSADKVVEKEFLE